MIIPVSRYPGRAVRDPEYQWGRARNATVPGDRTGTPFDAAWLADIWGQTQALLREAGIEPSGDPDTVTRSQFADAVERIIAQRVGRARGRGFDLRRAVPSIFREAPSTKLLAVSDDGRSMYVRSRTAQSVLQLGLVTPGDLRGGLAPDASSLALDEPVRSLSFRPGGGGVTIVDATHVREYALAEPWQIATATQLTEDPHGGLVHVFLLPDTNLYVNRGPFLGDWWIGSYGAAEQTFVSGPVVGLDVSPEGNSMILAIEDTQGAATRLTSMPIEDGVPATAELPHLAELQYQSDHVTPHGASISGVAWSHEGRRLFVGTADGLVGQLDTVHV